MPALPADPPGADADLEEELAQATVLARRTVAALSGAIRSAHVSASPSLARSVQAEENVYAAIDAEFGLVSSEEAGRRMGSRSAARRNLALAAQRDGRLLGVRRGRYQVYPAFQFDGSGVRPVVAELVQVARAHDWDPADLIPWLVAPTTTLDGRRPVDVIEEPTVLLAAAESAFAREW